MSGSMWAINSGTVPQTVKEMSRNFTVHQEWSLLGTKKFHCTAGQVHTLHKGTVKQYFFATS